MTRRVFMGLLAAIWLVKTPRLAEAVPHSHWFKVTRSPTRLRPPTEPMIFRTLYRSCAQGRFRYKTVLECYDRDRQDYVAIGDRYRIVNDRIVWEAV